MACSGSPSSIFLCHVALDVDGTTDSIKGAGELHQHTIVGGPLGLPVSPEN
jgi:hypothetical protein